MISAKTEWPAIYEVPDHGIGFSRALNFGIYKSAITSFKITSRRSPADTFRFGYYLTKQTLQIINRNRNKGLLARAINAMQLRLIFELLVVAVILAEMSEAATQTFRGDSSGWLGPEFMIVRKVYSDCQDKNDFVACLKEKALMAITRALDQDSIHIVDGLVLEKQNSTDKESIMTLADARTLNSLSELDRSLLEKTDQFLRTHVMKMDMSEGREHRDKKYSKKGGGHIKYVVAALLTAMGIAGPIGLKALAAIAIKALVISKVALTIASIIALKKLFSHDHQEETSFQVHAGEHNRRNAYVLRPMSKPTNAATAPSGVDPYRYYYEYH